MLRAHNTGCCVATAFTLTVSRLVKQWKIPPLGLKPARASCLLNPVRKSKDSPAGKLCLACGLCCNGVIFADVKLQAGDDMERLRAVGLPLQKPGGAENRPRTAVTKFKFDQPCAAHDGCHCRIYPDRPLHCRSFECLLLKSVIAGKTAQGEALGLVSKARQRADKVRQFLRELGDREETLALSARFRRTRNRLERGGLDEATAELYGQLTLAVHELNLLISQAFYPCP